MYEILVEDSFARWFEGLSVQSAERVAAALELDRATAPRFDPGRHSRLLLWFDGMHSASLEASVVESLDFLRAIPSQGALDRFREFIDWQQQALACLETEDFTRGLARLDPHAAADALVCVSELRNSLSDTRRGAGLALARRATRRHHRDASLELDASLLSQIEAVKNRLERALARVGLGLDAIVERDAGLRELAVADASPRLRVIYGLDTQNHKLVALTGDALDHAYYGDSVRRAEREWKRYRERRWLSLVGVKAGSAP